MEERGWGEFAINEDKDASAREGDYLHEGEVGVSGVDNTDLEARQKLCLAFTKMIKFYQKKR